MKKIYLIVALTISSFAWEINTHRAIGQEAINRSENLNNFIVRAGIKDKIYKYEKFEDYGNYTYFDYATDGEENGISSNKWRQTFKDTKWKSLIEAGSILEDAQWPHWLSTGWQYDYLDIGDGRFLNHFEDGQTSLGLHAKPNTKGNKKC